MHLGWTGRALLSGEEGPFNRNLAKIYGLAEGTDLGLKGLSAGLTCEGHYSPSKGPAADDFILALGGFVRYQRERYRAELGTSYQRFKYDYYRTVNEVSDVRSVRGELDYRLFRWLAMRLRYEFERFDRDIHTVTLSLRQGY